MSQAASWNGTQAYLYSSFSDSSQSSQVNAFGTFDVSNPNAPEGLTATFQITDPIVSTVTTDQPVYQLGQPVQLTDTEVNASDQSITIPCQQPAGFSITHNGTPVLIDAVPAIYLVGTETVAPGQVFSTSQTSRHHRNFRRFERAGPEWFVRDHPDSAYALSDPIGTASAKSAALEFASAGFQPSTANRDERFSHRGDIIDGTDLQVGAERPTLTHFERCHHQQRRHQGKSARRNRDCATRIDGGV